MVLSKSRPDTAFTFAQALQKLDDLVLREWDPRTGITNRAKNLKPDENITELGRQWVMTRTCFNRHFGLVPRNVRIYEITNSVSAQKAHKELLPLMRLRVRYQSNACCFCGAGQNIKNLKRCAACRLVVCEHISSFHIV